MLMNVNDIVIDAAGYLAPLAAPEPFLDVLTATKVRYSEQHAWSTSTTLKKVGAHWKQQQLAQTAGGRGPRCGWT